jgi:hypothetical protein
MECPTCKTDMKQNEEASKGMGNQAFFVCPVCKSIALCSGDVMTQFWPREVIYKGVNDVAFRTLCNL